jgi:acylpyruvate hydrolase
MAYQHINPKGIPWNLPVGKVVCVARNYYEHIRELNNPVPSEPIFFLKPATALQAIDTPIVIPDYSDNCHHETELTVLIGRRLFRADRTQAAEAVVAYGIGLDLTLRDVQQRLKEKGYPWEIAKAFDGSCPMSPLIEADGLADPQDTRLQLIVNGETRQDDSTRLMITGILDLLVTASRYFSLVPGDLLMTGTPAGVDRLQSGDRLELVLADQYRFSTTVA